MDIDKLQLLLSFKAQGAVLVEASMDDHRSLVAAVKQVDVVVSAMGGPHLLQQLKLVEAIKEAGNVQVSRSLCLLKQILIQMTIWICQIRSESEREYFTILD
jgi:hypothetical protein